MQAHVYHLTAKTPEARRDLYFALTSTYEEIWAGKNDKAAYVKVAVVDGDLDEAFELTNTIHQPWWKNAKVTPLLVNTRSTSVGDVIVLDGKPWICDAVGWVEIDVAHVHA